MSKFILYYSKISSFVILSLFLLLSQHVVSQNLMDLMDTTTVLGKGIFSLSHKSDQIRIGGYMQPQYQVASDEGISSYSGGDFPPYSNNRFTLRRGRIRFDYVRFYENRTPEIQFVFQFDGTERGVFIRDFWGRFWENKWQALSFTAGMFARPFGNEVNLSSSDRESPERGRMSQILMKSERDLGLMVSLEMRNTQSFMKSMKIEAGFFNGQGLTGTVEFDSYKDFISQIVLKPIAISSNVNLSGGVSFFYGGLRQMSNYAYRLKEKPGKVFIYEADSITTGIGDKSPRNYGGVNTQLKWKHGWGTTEIRAEYWQGVQSAYEYSSETPGSSGQLPSGFYSPYYIRNFKGAFFYFLQNIINQKHQLGIKFDFYDPNKKVKGSQIGQTGSNLNTTDIKYSTLGMGYIYYFDNNFKLVLWYDMVKNEKTILPGFQSDISDNVFTARVQFRF